MPVCRARPSLISYQCKILVAFKGNFGPRNEKEIAFPPEARGF